MCLHDNKDYSAINGSTMDVDLQYYRRVHL